MTRLPLLLPVVFIFDVLVCSSDCAAQNSNHRLSKLLKWESDWFKKIPSNPELFKTAVWRYLDSYFSKLDSSSKGHASKLRTGSILNASTPTQSDGPLDHCQ